MKEKIIQAIVKEFAGESLDTIKKALKVALAITEDLTWTDADASEMMNEILYREYKEQTKSI